MLTGTSWWSGGQSCDGDAVAMLQSGSWFKGAIGTTSTESTMNAPPLSSKKPGSPRNANASGTGESFRMRQEGTHFLPHRQLKTIRPYLGVGTEALAAKAIGIRA